MTTHAQTIFHDARALEAADRDAYLDKAVWVGYGVNGFGFPESEMPTPRFEQRFG